MLWFNFAIILTLLQLVSAPRELLKPDADWLLGAALLWCVASLFFAFSGSRALIQWGFKTYTKLIRPKVYARYQHWGMEDEAFGDDPEIKVVISSLWAAFSVFVAVRSVLPGLERAGLLPDSSEQFLGSLDLLSPGLGAALPYLVVAIVGGIQWGLLDRRGVRRRIDMFDSLSPVFHRRFPVTEILSMRECLRAAPEIFWKEYINLPDAMVNETTNRKFRERAAPYQTHQGEVTQRMMLSVAVATALLAVPALLFVLLEGTLIGWISGWFVPHNNP